MVFDLASRQVNSRHTENESEQWSSGLAMRQWYKVAFEVLETIRTREREREKRQRGLVVEKKIET